MTRYAYRYDKHPVGGWQTIYLSAYEDDPAKPISSMGFSPEMGCNWLSFESEGVEYIYGAGKMNDKAFLLGSPVLYPTPNRVRNAVMTFEGREFRFPANNNGNFLHGIVKDHPWVSDAPVTSAYGISVTSRITFEPGKSFWDLFPIRNTLELTYTLKPGVVRIDFTVVNQDNQARLPFGLAIHPFFAIVGPRESVRLQVPAQKWMEATDLLPSGRLIDLDKGPADLRQPVSLSQLNLDDVYWGLRSEAPQVIYYDHIGKKVTLKACDLFSYSVVFTPPERPFFCVENQSCSTDAHNLWAKGLKDESRLSILNPGESLTAWIEISVSNQ